MRHLIPRHPQGMAGLGALLLLATVAAVWLWAHEGHEPMAPRGVEVDLKRGEIVLSEEARLALDVQTVKVQMRSLEERITAPAVVVSPWQHHAFATSRIGGRITATHVHPGQTVQAGQPLVEVQSLELDNLQWELLNAHNDVRLSAETLTQLEVVVQRGAVAGQQLLEARARHQENLNNLDIARRKLLSLGMDEAFLDRLQQGEVKPLHTLPVRSPIGGEVIHAHAHPGQVVQPTDHLFDIVDLSTVWVQIAVLEKDWPRIEVGQPAFIRLLAHAGEVLPGRVQRKGLALDPVTHQGQIWVELKQRAERPILPGMFGQADIVLPGGKPTKTVPERALVRDGAERYVLLEEGPGQYVRRNVVVGRRSGGWVEIHSPEVVPGDRVVQVGNQELATLLPQGVLRPSPEAAQTMGLQWEPFGRHEMARTLTLSGVVDLLPNQRALIASRLPGALQHIHVDRGQPVQAGQVIAEVASLELKNLQLELLRHHLHAELLEETLQRLRTLDDRDQLALSRRQLREKESALNAARLRRDSLQRQLEAAGLSAEQVQNILTRRQLVQALPIRSPIAGHVVRFFGKLGQVVKAEDPLFEVHDLSRPVIQGFVSERHFAQVALGQKARVRLTADPMFLAEGVVVRSGQVFDNDDRTLSVWVELTQAPPALLLLGMMARLTLEVAPPLRVPAVPRSAVLTEGSRAYVFVRQSNGTVSRRLVTVGRSDDRRCEITHGLKEGEPVAISGVGELQTGYAALK